MKRGDRVFLIDSRGQSKGTIVAPSAHEGLVIVTWDSGMTERVAMSELTLVKPDTWNDTDEDGNLRGGLYSSEDAR